MTWRVSRSVSWMAVGGHWRGFEIGLGHQESICGGLFTRPVKDTVMIFPSNAEGAALARGFIEALHSVIPYAEKKAEAKRAELPGWSVERFDHEKDTPYVLHVGKSIIALRAEELYLLISKLADFFELVGVQRPST